MINVLDEKKKPIDWWFIYKLPGFTNTTFKNTTVAKEIKSGFKYLYYDTNQSKLSFSPNVLDKLTGALGFTLYEIFNSSPDVGYIVYNDQSRSATKKIISAEENGHTKGILAFNKKNNSGLWILHSTPSFPMNKSCLLPTDEADEGQTYLGMSLDYKTISEIAAIMLVQQNPFVQPLSYLPSNIEKNEPLSMLYHQTKLAPSAKPVQFDFKSRGEKQFTLLARSPKWALKGNNFWLDQVAPAVNSSMIIQSWRNRGRGKGAKLPPEHEVKKKVFIEDVQNIFLSPLGEGDYRWSYTKDHSKWGVSLSPSKQQGYVCVADLNRAISQEERGGGGVLFNEYPLAQSLRNIIAEVRSPKDTSG